MAESTTYIVLRATADETGWEYISKVANVGSAEAALRAAINTENGQAGTYVAVPKRSWKPVTVTTETRTVLKLEQPADQS
jgi:hypothetical protein